MTQCLVQFLTLEFTSFTIKSDKSVIFQMLHFKAKAPLLFYSILFWVLYLYRQFSDQKQSDFFILFMPIIFIHFLVKLQ